jgi:hypothetical protein
MTFKPGQSGNPSGKPVKMGKFLELISDDDIQTAYNAVMATIKSSNAKKKVDAAIWLLEMKFGKPRQSLAHSGENTNAIEVKFI